MGDDRGMRSLPAVATAVATVLGLLAAALATSAQAQGSLAERRNAITKGTAPGKVLLELPPLGAAAAAPAAASGTAATPAASAASGPGRGAAPPRSGLFSRLPPPSGRPMSAAQRLDAPDQGIVVKPAAPASAPR